MSQKGTAGVFELVSGAFMYMQGQYAGMRGAGSAFVLNVMSYKLVGRRNGAKVAHLRGSLFQTVFRVLIIAPLKVEEASP